MGHSEDEGREHPFYTDAVGLRQLIAETSAPARPTVPSINLFHRPLRRTVHGYVTRIPGGPDYIVGPFTDTTIRYLSGEVQAGLADEWIMASLDGPEVFKAQLERALTTLWHRRYFYGIEMWGNEGEPHEKDDPDER